MDAGQTFFTAHTLGPERVYAWTESHEATGKACGLVTYAVRGRPAAFPESDVYPTEAEAKAACILQLKRHREEVLAQIDGKIAELEAAT